MAGPRVGQTNDGGNAGGGMPPALPSNWATGRCLLGDRLGCVRGVGGMAGVR